MYTDLSVMRDIIILQAAADFTRILPTVGAAEHLRSFPIPKAGLQLAECATEPEKQEVYRYVPHVKARIPTGPKWCVHSAMGKG